MRVLHFLHSLAASTGGPSRSVPRLCIALKELGVNVDLCYQDASEPSAEAKDFMSRFDLVNMTHALSRVGADRYDIVHIHGIWQIVGHQLAGAARRRRVPYVVSPRGMLEPWALAQKPLKKKIAWWLYQRRDLADATVLHATADDERANILRLLNVPVEVIPNGVDSAPTVVANALPPRSVLFLSRLHPKKGLELLIGAVIRLRELWLVQGWTLHIVGPSEPYYRASIVDLVARNNLSDLVLFHEPADGLMKWNYLSSATVVVLPTYSENFGMVVAEALSAGTPVISTTGTPWRELETWQCGWWVAPEITELTRALAEATSLRAETLAAMGERGAALMRERYEWSSVGRRMTDLYEDVLLRDPT